MRILKLTLLVVLCACTHSLYAQRHYAGVSALEFNYGMNMFGDCDNNLSLSVSNRVYYYSGKEPIENKKILSEKDGAYVRFNDVVFSAFASINI